MIFPLLRGLLWFHRAPVTWLMVALNVGIFAWTFPAYRAADQAIEDILDDDSFIATNGLLYASSLKTAAKTTAAAKTPSNFVPASVVELAQRSLQGNEEARIVLGHLALRQADFVRKMREQFDSSDRAAGGPGAGDAVAIDRWRETAERLQEIQNVHPSYRLGLSKGHSEIWRWFSYQIAHSGAIHLFWNMIFLLLFGTFVEHSRGWKATLLTIWLSGVGGAIAFMALSGLSASPLVGASAAVSGLIALSARHGHRRLPFVYWLLPFRGYYGVAWLPAWILVPGFVLPDLTGWVSAQPGLSAVAYTAHLGGAAVGWCLGHFFVERPEAFHELSQGATGAAASSTRLAA